MTAWASVGGVSLNRDPAHAASVPVGYVLSDSEIYVAWIEDDGTGTFQVYCSEWNGAVWVPLGDSLNQDPSISAFDCEISFDTMPVVTWIEGAHLYVAQWDGAAWNLLGADLSETGNPQLGSLYPLTDGLGIAYRDDDGTTFTIYTKQWNGASWATLGTTYSSSSALPVAQAILAERLGQPVVFYVLIGPPDVQHVVVWDGAAWNSGGSFDTGDTTGFSGGGVGYRRAAAIAPDGTGYVAWDHEIIGGEVITAFQWDGAMFTQVGADFSDGVTELSYQGSVMFDGVEPLISCFDDVSDDAWYLFQLASGWAHDPADAGNVDLIADSFILAAGVDTRAYITLASAGLIYLRSTPVSTPPPPPPPTPSGTEANVPSLYVCGTEISNPARAWSYLKNGLGSAWWKVGANCIPAVYFEGDGSEPLVFTDPATDPAPWYDPAQPESAEFLGVILTSLDGFDSTVSRTVTQRAGGIQGGSIGSQHLDARVMPFHGFLIANSCCGLEYGRRWLINTLSAAPCDPCGLCDITVRICQPPSDASDDQRGEWNLYDTALISGPTMTAQSQDGEGGLCCDYYEFDATITAGNPFLYKAKQGCVDATPLQPDAGGSDCIPFEDWFCGPPSAKICCTVDPPLIGTLGAIITIDASIQAVGGVEIGTYLTCPPADDTVPAFSIIIPLLVQGSILVIDSARRVITYTAPDGTVLDGTQFIQFPEGRSMDWIEVSDCSPASCICVNALHPCSGGDQAYVTIQTQARVR